MPIRRSRKSKPIVRKRASRKSSAGRIPQPAIPAKRKSRKSVREKRKAADEGVGSGNRRVSRKQRISKRKFSKYAKATDDMTIIELQKMAREQGIPFGGLSKSKLLRKINKYLETYY